MSTPKTQMSTFPQTPRVHLKPPNVHFAQNTTCPPKNPKCPPLNPPNIYQIPQMSTLSETPHVHPKSPNVHCGQNTPCPHKKIKCPLCPKHNMSSQKPQMYTLPKTPPVPGCPSKCWETGPGTCCPTNLVWATCPGPPLPSTQGPARLSRGTSGPPALGPHRATPGPGGPPGDAQDHSGPLVTQASIGPPGHIRDLWPPCETLTRMFSLWTPICYPHRTSPIAPGATCIKPKYKHACAIQDLNSQPTNRPSTALIIQALETMMC